MSWVEGFHTCCSETIWILWFWKLKSNHNMHQPNRKTTRYWARDEEIYFIFNRSHISCSWHFKSCFLFQLFSPLISASLVWPGVVWISKIKVNVPCKIFMKCALMRSGDHCSHCSIQWCNTSFLYHDPSCDSFHSHCHSDQSMIERCICIHFQCCSCCWGRCCSCSYFHHLPGRILSLCSEQISFSFHMDCCWRCSRELLQELQLQDQVQNQEFHCPGPGYQWTAWCSCFVWSLDQWWR